MWLIVMMEMLRREVWLGKLGVLRPCSSRATTVDRAGLEEAGRERSMSERSCVARMQLKRMAIGINHDLRREAADISSR